MESNRSVANYTTIVHPVCTVCTDRSVPHRDRSRQFRTGGQPEVARSILRESINTRVPCYMYTVCTSCGLDAVHKFPTRNGSLSSPESSFGVKDSEGSRPMYLVHSSCSFRSCRYLVDKLAISMPTIFAISIQSKLSRKQRESKETKERVSLFYSNVQRDKYFSAVAVFILDRSTRTENTQGRGIFEQERKVLSTGLQVHGLGSFFFFLRTTKLPRPCPRPSLFQDVIRFLVFPRTRNESNRIESNGIEIARVGARIQRFELTSNANFSHVLYDTLKAFDYLGRLSGTDGRIYLYRIIKIVSMFIRVNYCNTSYY